MDVVKLLEDLDNRRKNKSIASDTEFMKYYKSHYYFNTDADKGKKIY